MKVDVIIPIYKPGKDLLKLIYRLQVQTLQPSRIILMNTDKEQFELFDEEYHFTDKYKNIEIYHVDKEDFDHGNTRHLGVSKSDGDIFVMMTQDAIPSHKKMLELLVSDLMQEKVAVAYARQIADSKCGEIEALSRAYNYPDIAMIKTKDQLEYIGIKTYFSSNVCAAYKREIYNTLGGFTFPTIFNEDLLYGAKCIQAEYKIAYAAEAKVIHSHNYCCMEQFKRNFDNGVSQKQYATLLNDVSSEKEGIKFVKFAIDWLKKNDKSLLIPYFIIQSGFKFVGFALGKRYTMLPQDIILKCTSNPHFWKHNFF